MTNRIVMADARRLVERAYPEQDTQEPLRPWEVVEPEPHFPAVRVVDYQCGPVERDARLLGVVVLSMMTAVVLLCAAPWWSVWLEGLLP